MVFTGVLVHFLVLGHLQPSQWHCLGGALYSQWASSLKKDEPTSNKETDGLSTCRHLSNIVYNSCAIIS